MTIAFDFETIKLLPDGTKTASADFWHPDFRVDSCAFSWREDGKIVSRFIQGEDEVGKHLKECADLNHKMVCHNLGFEWGVISTRYPHLNFNISNLIDTMRLAQLYDGGGRDDEFDWVFVEENALLPSDQPTKKRIPLQGLGLSKCSHRILGNTVDHKKEAYDWLMTNVPECTTKKKAGSLLDRLPYDILERYNIADSEITLQLYEFIATEFNGESFNWEFDHLLYRNTTDLVVKSKIRGVPIDRPHLTEYRLEILEEIRQIEDVFRQRFLPEILALELKWDEEWVNKPKSYRGKCVRFIKFMDGKYKTVFNVGSNKQLQALFTEQLNIVPKFFTDKGAPSFKSSMLSQWGDGGNIIKSRRKALLRLKQTEALLSVSEYDGSWHLGLKVAAAKSGRMAGGG